MTNSKILFDNLIEHLKLPEPNEEIRAIALLVLDYFGISRTDVLSQKQVDLDFGKLQPIVDRLNQHEPVQYILNEAWFYGHKFYVDPSVLIPRPETELLVDEAAKYISSKRATSISILDIGTGSGCIAISLALQFPQAKVVAIDISEDALLVAKKNANALGAKVDFIRTDILEGISTDQNFDLIVSNPPYISMEEKDSLSKNVVDFEPHLALFAPNNDPLTFYRKICRIVPHVIHTNGLVLLELNSRFADQAKSIFENELLANCSILEDLSGRNRFLQIFIP